MSIPDPRWCALLKRGSEAASAPRPAAPPAPAPRPEADRVDFDPRYDPSAPVVCEVCGFQMRYTAACKLQCGNCGYKRDCSDP